MEIFDSHTHLFLEEFDPDREEVIQRAYQAGVRYFVNIGLDPKTTNQCVHLADIYPGFYVGAGIHPSNIANTTLEDLIEITNIAKHPKVVGFGEIGLDFFRRSDSRDKQLKFFPKLLDIAVTLKKPVIIHTREAFPETYQILKNFHSALTGILIHCFQGTPEEAQKYLDLGCFLSIPGVITFHNSSRLREAVKVIPRDKILVETDAPYLAPMPFRGKRNEPAYLLYHLKALGEIWGVSQEKVADITTQNAADFFGIF
ncbi:MAG: TatD family hydrolase [Deltaproteobacteria bacterium]|jgi:TatD DNase family protein|nr:TatD family hydrolase [Deltaproteobacteria bacterium]